MDLPSFGLVLFEGVHDFLVGEVDTLFLLFLGQKKMDTKPDCFRSGDPVGDTIVH